MSSSQKNYGKSSNGGFTISTEDFLALVYHATFGEPLGRGFKTYTIGCPNCNERQKRLRAVGSKGFSCWYCTYKDPNFVWPWAYPQMPNDGCWLEPLIADRAGISHN